MYEGPLSESRRALYTTFTLDLKDTLCQLYTYSTYVHDGLLINIVDWYPAHQSGTSLVKG